MRSCCCMTWKRLPLIKERIALMWRIRVRDKRLQMLCVSTERMMAQKKKKKPESRNLDL